MLESLRKSMELESITGWSRHGAADALRANGWDVRKTLAALIESGEVALSELDREKCPPDLFAAAEAKAAEAAAAAARREQDLPAVAASPAAQEFPELTIDEHGEAQGKVVLPSWKDCYVAVWYGKPAPDDREPEERHGIFRITVNGGGKAGAKTARWTKPQREAYRFLKQNEPAVGRAVLEALFRFYRDEVIPRRADWFPATLDAAEMERRLPPASSADDMRRLVALDGVFVWRKSKAGVAYTGFAFDCPWDNEHAAGVVTHQARVVTVAEASAAFDEGELEDATPPPAQAGPAA